jgi:adenosylcobinamide-phosphate synthase
MLRTEAARVHGALTRGDLQAARDRLPALVGRDPAALDESGIAAAVIESVAENTVDAVVAPALWGAVLGAPGACGYRAVNTMDSMVGNRSARYRRFGWASARADDLANFLPARATAALVCLAAPARAPVVAGVVRRDAPRHPSPNAGVAEAAFAASLGVELGGTLRYGERVEHRPLLGTGPRPSALDIPRAIALANRVELLLVALLAATGLMILARRRANVGRMLRRCGYLPTFGGSE